MTTETFRLRGLDLSLLRQAVSLKLTPVVVIGKFLLLICSACYHGSASTTIEFEHSG